MKRAIFLGLVVTLMAAPALLAQEQPPPQQGQQAPEVKKPKPADPADIEKLTGRAYPQAEAEPAPKPGHPLAGEAAPKKGHPLDWRDVDILTGKADRNGQPSGYRGYGAPYVYTTVPAAGSRFGSSGYSRFGGDTRTSPLPFRRVFRGSLPFPTFLIFR